MLDVLIRGGEVVDGTGGPRRRADVAIQGDTVVEIGLLDGEAGTVIDALCFGALVSFAGAHLNFAVDGSRGSPSIAHRVCAPARMPSISAAPACTPRR